MTEELTSYKFACIVARFLDEKIAKDISILKDDSYKPENAKYTLNNPFKAKNINFNFKNR